MRIATHKNLYYILLIFIPFSFIGLSLLLLGYSQPDLSITACMITAACGYAIFWKGLLYFPFKRQRFFIAFLWFAGVQAIHLNWFATDKYVGSIIYVFLFILCAVLGLFFGIFSLFVCEKSQLTIWRILAISGAWTIFEWSRLFFLSGFSWDPIGLTLTSTTAGMQLAAAFGIFGLTFWVLFSNLFALRLFFKPFAYKDFCIWLIIAATPYIFGFIELHFHDRVKTKFSFPTLKTLVLQSAIYPEQKMAFSSQKKDAYTPLEQWRRILELFEGYKDHKFDLIAFSEAAVPYGTYLPIYKVSQVSEAFEDFFNVSVSSTADSKMDVGNAFWVQALSSYFNSDVIIGLEDIDLHESKEPEVFNAAFLFSPKHKKPFRYEKRVLVPIAEYIPFEWCKKIASKYGIGDSFIHGKEAKVFKGKTIPIGLSICYEETYGHLMREARLKGAQVLVNLTNDVWYPRSRLPIVHYLHGRVRAVESGIPMLRSTNTGVTCAIDSLGRTLAQLPFENCQSTCRPGILSISLPLYHYPTLYSRYGDQLIIWFSLIAVLLGTSATLFPVSVKKIQKI